MTSTPHPAETEALAACLFGLLPKPLPRHQHFHQGYFGVKHDPLQVFLFVSFHRRTIG
jgi:hypothetical protein